MESFIILTLLFLLAYHWIYSVIIPMYAISIRSSFFRHRDELRNVILKNGADLSPKEERCIKVMDLLLSDIIANYKTFHIEDVLKQVNALSEQEKDVVEKISREIKGSTSLSAIHKKIQYNFLLLIILNSSFYLFPRFIMQALGGALETSSFKKIKDFTEIYSYSNTNVGTATV